MSHDDASSPFIWPPLIYATAAVVSGLLAWLWPMSLPELGSAMQWTVRGVGAALFVLGAAIMQSGKRRFAGAGTPVRPNQPTTALVTDGLYRRTRNPMYLGATLMLIGLGVAFWSWWFLIATPAAMLAVTKLAIEREEVYLARRFGQPYLDYCARTRRWL